MQGHRFIDNGTVEWEIAFDDNCSANFGGCSGSSDHEVVKYGPLPLQLQHNEEGFKIDVEFLCASVVGTTALSGKARLSSLRSDARISLLSRVIVVVIDPTLCLPSRLDNFDQAIESDQLYWES